MRRPTSNADGMGRVFASGEEGICCVHVVSAGKYSRSDVVRQSIESEKSD